MQVTQIEWFVTIGVTMAVLLFDIIFIARRPHEPTFKECAIALSFYVGLAVAFGVWVWMSHGSQYGVEFYAGWFVWRDERYRGKHETIFTADEWERLHATFGKKAKYGSKMVRHGALTGFMRCAECGCLVCYDPKVKPSGKRYDYYRCTNGHRVHEKLVHVTEQNLLAQFEAAVANIEIPHALADEISRVLRETHDVVAAERRREIAKLKTAVDELQQREDKVVAMYVDNKLDDVTYKRQREMLLTEKHGAIDRLNVASEDLDDKYLATADRVFELAKKARSLWNRRTPSEQRELLEMVLSNPQLDGSTVRYEMKKSFAILGEMAKGPDWRARRDSNTGPPL